MWLPASNKTKGHFFPSVLGGYGFLPPKCSINKLKEKPSRSIFLTAPVYLEIANDDITWVQSLLKMPAFPESHGKQLLGDRVYAFNYLQLVYTTCCSRNNNFIICNKKLKGKFFYVSMHSISFVLPSKQWDQAGVPYLQALSESTCALSLNTGLPWSMGFSNTAKEKGESTSGADSEIQHCTELLAYRSWLAQRLGNLTCHKMQPFPQ